MSTAKNHGVTSAANDKFQFNGSIKQIPCAYDYAGLVRAEESLPEVQVGRWGRYIFINPDHHVHRQRFSLLHEYKHVIDYPVYQTAYPATPAASHEVRREAICDYFAACVLMPRVLVRRAWTGFSQDPKELAGLFGVSPAAMRYRLTDLGLLERQRCQTTFFRTTPDTARQADLISTSVVCAGALH